MRLGIDLMGSDSSPQQLFEAVVAARKEIADLEELVVFAVPLLIKELSKQVDCNHDNGIRFIEASQVISMEESPLLAFRNKGKASLFLGLTLLANKGIDALVSAGNTGALVVGARKILRPLPYVDKPALLALLPTFKGSMVMIDVGGNVKCASHHLVQFTQMGIAYQRIMMNKLTPTVGLLNIGVESIKGTPELKKAYRQLAELYPPSSTQAHFCGNIEGKVAFQGEIDVLITDGFAGNIFLKAAEGTFHLLFALLKRECEPSLLASLPLQKIQQIMNEENSFGALLCGVQNIVIKCHGNSSAKAMLNGIRSAANLVKNHFIEKISGIF